MRPLSNLDTSFLQLETLHTPMHMVGIFIFRDTPDAPMSAARFRQHVISRLPEARIFRERLVTPPLGMGQLFWADDPHFDIEDHLHFAEMEGPLDQARIQPLADRFFTPLLNRKHPLWEILFVSEVDSSAIPRNAGSSRRFAVILKVHHAACDGLSAKAIITGLFDGPQPQPRNANTEWQPEPLPSLSQVLAQNLHAARTLPKRSRQLLRDLSHSATRSLALRRRHPLAQPLFFTSPVSAFNIAVDEARTRLSVDLSLPLLKMIRKSRPDLTVNDVVLTVCGGALRRYLISLGQHPQQSLIAMAPVSKREDGSHSDAGNKVSAMLVALGTNTDDPLERLQRVRENTGRAKHFNTEVAVEKLLENLPALPTSAFLRAFTLSRLSVATPPIFNLVITNIAALPAGLNLCGAPLDSVATFAPVYDGMGLSLVILSHNDTTTIGITSTPQALTHPALFATCLRQSLEELALATGVIVRETPQNSVQPWTPPASRPAKKRPVRPDVVAAI